MRISRGWRHRFRRFWAVMLALAVIGAAPGAARAQAGGALFDDPRIERWSKEYLSGGGAKLVREVEADLRGPSPHPFAAHVWLVTQRSLGKLDAIDLDGDAALRDALGDAPLAYRRVRAGEASRLLAEHPPEKAAQVRGAWALFYLDGAASGEARPRDALAYLHALSSAHPELFFPAWRYASIAGSTLDGDDAVRRDVLMRARAGGALGRAATSAFLEAVLRPRPTSAIDRLAAVKAFLRARPRDAFALAYEAWELSGLGRPAEAADAFHQAIEAYPFYPRWEEEARMRARAGQLDRARALAERGAALEGLDAEATTQLGRQWFAAALFEAGERGEARKVIEEALHRWPHHEGLNAALAALELDGGRAERAIPWAREAAARAPASASRRAKLIEALRRAGKPEHLVEAQRIFEAADAAGMRSDALFSEESQLLLALHRAQDRVKLCERAVQAYPGASWLAWDLAFRLREVDSEVDKKRAIEVLRSTFQVDAPAGWTLDLLTEWLGDAAAVQAELAGLLVRFPWVEAVWAAKAKGLGPDAQLEVWREAQAKNPGRVWPVEQAIYVLQEEQRWDEVDQALERAAQALGAGAEGDRAELLLLRGSSVRWRAQRQIVEKGALERGLAALREYRGDALHGDPARALAHEVRILLLLDRKEEAARAALERAALLPDDVQAQWDLFRNHTAHTAGQHWVRAKRYLDRDPWDGDRLDALAQMHIMWSGSPIVGLHYLHLIRQRTSRDPTSLEGMAYGQLGDARRDYEARYADARGVSASDRYVEWYDHARLTAQKESSHVEVDPEKMTATISYADGETATRRDHPISGKVMSLERGKARLECEYDAIGYNLNKLRAASGSAISFTYDAEGKIVRMTQTRGAGRLVHDISMSYNERGKPTRIAVKSTRGNGELRVTYDAAGEIAKVDSTGGRAVAQEVAQAFQRLRDRLAVFARGQSEAPELPFADVDMRLLRYEVNAKTRAWVDMSPGPARDRALTELVRLKTRFAEYLSKHVAESRDYASYAESVLEEIVETAEEAKDDGAIVAQAIKAVASWHDLMHSIRPKGLTARELARWMQMHAWVESQEKLKKSEAAARRVLGEVDRQPLRLLDSERWLTHSDLSNPGAFRAFPLQSMLPAGLARPRIQASLVRKNGDVVMGTSGGLLLLRRGFWEWLALDEGPRDARLSRVAAPDKVGPGSDVRALAEDGDGLLWLGTADGLVALPDGYEGAALRWRTPVEGLPDARVGELAALASGVIAGTERGARLFTRAGEGQRLGPLHDEAILAAEGAGDPDGARALVASAAGLYVVEGGQARRIVEGSITSAAWAPDRRRIVFVRGGALSSVRLDGDDLEALDGQQEVVGRRGAPKLTRVPLGPEGEAVAVLTAEGAWVHVGLRFEPLTVPIPGASPILRTVASRDRRTFFATDDAIYAQELDRIARFSGAVSDLLTLDELGITLVASADGLAVVRHDKVGDGPVSFSDGSIAATHLARHPSGGFVVDDGLRILRFDPKEREPTELFRATQTIPPGAAYGPSDRLSSLLVASDGTVWATAGASVFRFHDGDKKAEEYGTFVDRARFPAPTGMVSRVLETIDHRIWVVASNEGHLSHEGVVLSGGLVEWDGAAFRRFDHVDTNLWFLSSYTPIDDRTAIAGTAAGFARHTDRRLTFLPDEPDAASYSALIADHPAFLGTRGARFGQDLWLFGSAGGVVAFDGAAWHYPDRLNAMLPAHWLHCVGARAVHAVETDRHGRVYAGTDRGLLIYDAGGTDAAAFLLSNQVGWQAKCGAKSAPGGDEAGRAFRRAEEARVRREAGVVLDPAPAGAAADYAKSRSEKDRIQRALTRQTITRATGADGVADAPELLPAPKKAELEKALEAQEKDVAGLAKKLEGDAPALLELLAPSAAAIAELEKKVGADEALVRYLPAEKALYIEITTQAGHEIVEIAVAREALLERARVSAARLAGAPAASLRARVLDRVAARGSDDDLAWLYDQLLRPIEGRLAGKRRIAVVAAEDLAYLPLGALVRATAPRLERAVERFSFGYLDSIAELGRARRSEPAAGGAALIFADPEGTDPVARAEGASVLAILGEKARLEQGAGATLAALRAGAPGARVVHLALPGFLAHGDPKQSYLALAGGMRMAPAAIAGLPLTGTDLVVVSGLDRGLGEGGLEVTSMVRAFTAAGARAVLIAPRSASAGATRVMESFYRALQGGDDAVAALTRAQREASGGGVDAGIWAGYRVFGRP